MWIAVERFDDAKPRAGAGAAIRARSDQCPMNVIERMPSEVFVETLPADDHIPGDMAKPPGDHRRCQALKNIVLDVHHHAPAPVIAERCPRAVEWLERPRQFAWCGKRQPA